MSYILNLRECEIRGQDPHGNGEYLAPRGSHKHRGIDLVCTKGHFCISLEEGVVTKIGYPYSPTKYPEKGHFRYVQVRSNDLEYRYFYLDPQVTLGDKIKKGMMLGKSQDLTEVYAGITQHVHFEVKDKGKILDPRPFLL